MATPSQAVIAVAIAARAATTASATSLKRSLARTGPVPVGETLLGGYGITIGYKHTSNLSWPILRMTIIMVHHLSDWSNSATYLYGDCINDMAVLGDPDLYEDLAQVMEVIEPPEVSRGPEREGNCIVYEVQVEFTVA